MNVAEPPPPGENSATEASNDPAPPPDEAASTAPAQPAAPPPAAPPPAAPSGTPPDASTEKRFRQAVLAVFALALVLRLAFVFAVQSPGNAIYSDMQRYMNEALDLVGGNAIAPLTAVCKPPGMAWYLAAQIKIFGQQGFAPMAVLQALLGAAPAAFMMLAAKRVFRSERLVGPLAVGLAVALWYPLLTFTGYFSSEVPFAFLLTLAFWLWVRFLQTGEGALVAGLVTGLSYPLRPQIALTVALVVGLCLLDRRKHAWLGLRKAALVLAPITVAVVLCAVRFHAITGTWGLISNNNAVMGFFAATDYQQVVTFAYRPDGTRNAQGFQPPPRVKSEGFTKEFVVESAYCDPKPLVAEKARFVANASIPNRLARIGRNITYLAYRNSLWPESKEARAGIRKTMAVVGRYAGSYLLVPLALAGLALLGTRRSLGLEIAAMHVLALLYTAAFYFGEARYRVPYDPVLILLAVYAVLCWKKIEPAEEGPPLPAWRRYGVLGAVVGLAVFVMFSWAGHA